jgi:hypothetical protein
MRKFDDVKTENIFHWKKGTFPSTEGFCCKGYLKTLGLKQANKT